MTYQNYVLYLKGTIDSYSTKIKKHLLKEYEQKGIIASDSQMTIFSSQESVDVVDLGLQEQIKKCINNSQEAIKLFEKWEFTKDYNYSALFEIDDFESFILSCKGFDDLSTEINCENEHFSDVLENPIRFDKLKKIFLTEKEVQTVYIDIIDNIQNFCMNNLNTQLNAIDLEFIISDVKDSKGDSNVRLMSQYTKLPKGGNAQLEVGKNEDYVLPIIGELKELLLMPNHIIELEKSPQLKDALNQFLFENEELSDYSWIEVMWENEVKTRSIRVKFIFNYMHNGYCLLQHYYNNVLVGMERMNDVTEYIVRRKNSTSA